ncbi:MAG: aminoacyl-tRNA hydrolase [Oscillospiraceae bacterium]|jgi:PTH1 family peptidyl-tRNA hydrolase|nr:aminoacyl-tRNA hydrolase [Oscillospiraceae bacterium]
MFNFFRNKEGNLDFIIVGLGNPGEKYKNTRHNAGFNAIDYMAEKMSLEINVNKFSSFCSKTFFLNSKKVKFIKPQTFINLSGESVRKFMKFFNVIPQKTIILLDDINFEVGKFKVKMKGSSGGHNGMKSIINTCESEDFIRIKIGVGRKPEFFEDLKDWVLSKFTEEESKILNFVYEESFLRIKSIFNSF